ncbi:hypothetical protein [Comamonas sp. JC664]
MLAVVRPASLWEQWQVLEAAVAAGRIVIMQAATPGSPRVNARWQRL